MAIKKDFSGIDNPALSFISTPPGVKRDIAPSHEDTEKEKAPKAKNDSPVEKPKPVAEDEQEKRSRRATFALTPSLYEGLEKMSFYEGKKLNDLVHAVLQGFVDDNRDKVRKVEEIKKQLYN